MARRAKTFAINSVSVLRIEGSGGAARIRAEVSVAQPDALVELELRTAPGRVKVTRLVVEVDPRSEITTTLLRGVLIDPMVRATVACLNPRTATPAADRRREKGTDRAAEAARLYQEATSARSPAPTEYVTQALGYSRSQASRYIRAARDRGLLPGVSRA